MKSLQKALDKFAPEGISVLRQDKFFGGGGLAYMGSNQIGGIIMEIVQRPPDYDPEKEFRYE